MSTFSIINNFQSFETALAAAETQISWVGTRFIILNIQKDSASTPQKIQLTLSNFFEICHKLTNNKLDTKEKQCGAKALTYLTETILKKFDAELKKNCFKRLIVAIRDFFSCFFKNLLTQVENSKLKLSLHESDTKSTLTPQDSTVLGSSTSSSTAAPTTPIAISAITIPTPQPEQIPSAIVPQSTPKEAALSNIVLPSPAPTLESGTDRFEGIHQQLRFVIKTFLTPSSYSALLSVKQSIKNLLKGYEGLTFDPTHLKKAYQIKNRTFKTYEFPLEELNLRYDDSKIQQAWLRYSAHILMENDYFFTIGTSRLRKKDSDSMKYEGRLLKVNYHSTPIQYEERRFIPKEAFNPPRTDDKPIHAGVNFHKINDQYFALVVYHEVSIWSFHTLECIYASEREKVDTYFTHQKLMISSHRKADQTIIVSKKDFVDLKAPMTQVKINLPRDLVYKGYCQGSVAGLRCYFDTCLIIFDWETGLEHCRLNITPNHSLASTLVLKNYLIAQERDVPPGSEYYHPRKLRMVHIATNATSDIEVLALEQQQHLHAEIIFEDKYLLTILNSQTVALIDLETRSTLKKITIPDSFWIKDYLFTTNGNILLTTVHNDIYRLVIYEKFTDNILFYYDSPIVFDVVERGNFLVINEPDTVVFIDLTNFTILTKFEKDKQGWHCIQNGRIVTSNIMRHGSEGSVRVLDYDYLPKKRYNTGIIAPPGQKLPKPTGSHATPSLATTKPPAIHTLSSQPQFPRIPPNKPKIANKPKTGRPSNIHTLF